MALMRNIPDSIFYNGRLTNVQIYHQNVVLLWHVTY